LKNPKLVSTNSVSYSSGNYLLIVDPANYIKPSKIALGDLENWANDLKNIKETNAAQQKLLNEQKKEIDDLKKLISRQEKQLDEQKRKIEELQRKVK